MQGLSNRQVADRLYIAEQMDQLHREFEKMKIHR
jgi:hypothetical protein